MVGLVEVLGPAAVVFVAVGAAVSVVGLGLAVAEKSRIAAVSLEVLLATEEPLHSIDSLQQQLEEDSNFEVAPSPRDLKNYLVESAVALAALLCLVVGALGSCCCSNLQLLQVDFLLVAVDL